MRILVTGKNGQVGHELLRSLASLGEVIGVDIEDCDLSQPNAIVALVDRVQPDIIINPAAYTAVDKAESEPAMAHAINAQAPEVLTKQAARRNIPIIHYSTDYVFDGKKIGAYTEEDMPNPQSVYGKTKWLGEEAVRNHTAKHIILRTSWVFGAHGANFLKTMLWLAQERDKLSIVADQVGAPTSASMLADVTAEIVRQLFESDAHHKYGTYHLVADGEASWHSYAQLVVKLANAGGVVTKVTPEAIGAITTQEYPMPATRPANSRLNTDKIKRVFMVKLAHWQHEVERVLKQVLQG